MTHVGRSLVVSVTFVAACGILAPHINAPKGLAGDVPVTLVNDTEGSLCGLKLAAGGAWDGWRSTAEGDSPPGDNLLGGAFFAHKSGTIKLKPGSYDIWATGRGCGVPNSGMTRFTVQTATEVHLGGTSATAATAGATVVNVSMSATAGGGVCLALGNTNATAENPCCTHHVDGGGACCQPEAAGPSCVASF